MGYVWTCFLFLFVSARHILSVASDDQSSNITSWKEPPINSSNGEGIATVVVKENGEPGSSTGIKLRALGGKGNISYIIAEQPNPLYFSIGRSFDDEVMISTPVDYEKVRNVTVTVIALDQGHPQNTGTARMTIVIGDVNDNAPVFEKMYNTTISELAELYMPFICVSASDADGTSPNNKVSYSLGDEHTNGSFDIDASSGNISVARQLVWAERSQYELTVVAKDGGSNPRQLSTTATVQIYIEKAETFTSWKQPPISTGIGKGTATVKVKENSAPGTSTGIKLQALGGNGTVTYTIIDHRSLRYFSIGGKDMDELIVATPVDFEARTNVILTVQAEDSAQPSKTGRATMTILIDDKNDNRPVFLKKYYRGDISEEAPVGSAVLTVIATDNDRSSPNNIVKYTILDENKNNDFSISPTTGVISVRNRLQEVKMSNYDMIILAVDAGRDPSPLTGTTTVAIVINREDHTTASTSKPSNAGLPTPCVFAIFTSVICIFGFTKMLM